MNNKLICVVGAGNWGKNHVRTLSELGSLGGIVDQNKERLHELSIRYPGTKVFRRVEEAVRGPFDGFVVSTPAETHYDNVKDPRSKYPQRGSEFYRATLVREGASIGANATVVCGVTIGRHAFIGAGAVVTDDVPDFALMLGVPARRKGWICECGQILPKTGEERVCPRCDLRYVVIDGRLCLESGPSSTQPNQSHVAG